MHDLLCWNLYNEEHSIILQQTNGKVDLNVNIMLTVGRMWVNNIVIIVALCLQNYALTMLFRNDDFFCHQK